MHPKSWSEATSFEDLCQLAARFLSGDLDSFPGWLAQDLEPETERLAPILVPMNRAGFLSVASQRGHAPRRGPTHHGTAPSRARRSFVLGFASTSTAARLARAASGREGEIRIDLFPARAGAPEEGHPTLDVRSDNGPDPQTDGVPVGLLDGTPFLVAGQDAAQRERETFATACPSPAIAALARCTWVSAVDLAWEDRPLLWEFLAEALLPGQALPQDLPPA